LETLYAEANSIRKEKIEDFVCIHGIIEFSNYCKNNCLYCGIRKDNKESKRYRMKENEIIETAKDAVENEGYKLLVLQSGEDDYYSDKMLIDLVKKIKSQMKVFIFLSVGERSEIFYKNAWKVGATGSLIRFETSNRKLYAKMRPEHKLNDRIQSIKYQQKLGYYVVSGSLVGLPGQTISDIADDLLMIKKLGIPMISAGPWLPAKGTPLVSYKECQIELFLKYIAVARFMMPEIKIPVTTALETLDPENGRHRGLLAGANALMFNLTPERYAGKYSIYDNKYREREKVWQKYGLFKGEESWEMLENKLQIFTRNE
jgi:biotin synthase